MAGGTVGDAVGIEDLEASMALGWWPLEHQRLGDWLLRASAGFTSRGNSALPLGDPGLDLPEAVAAVEAFYRQRDLAPRFAVPGPVVGEVNTGGLVSALTERGYEVLTPTAVMTAGAREVTGLDAPDNPVRLLEEPDEEWLQLYRYRGQPSPPEARELLVSAPYQRFAAVVDRDSTVAVGRLAIAGGWAGITAMEVAESHRRRGLARVVLRALAEHSLERGTGRIYLQVAADNSPARNLYAAAGFRDHHGYHYRVLS